MSFFGFEKKDGHDKMIDEIPSQFKGNFIKSNQEERKDGHSLRNLQKEELCF